MGAIDIFPHRRVTTTGAGISTITTNLTVPAGKRWLIGKIDLNFGVAAANNTADIQAGQGGAGFANKVEQFLNFNHQQVDLVPDYIRGIELEAGDVLRTIMTRGTNSTCETIVRYIERAL